MLAGIRGQLWAMRPESVTELGLSALEAIERVPVAALDDVAKEYLSNFYTLRKPMTIDDGIATIQIVGGLMGKAASIQEELGLVTRYETIISETKKAKEMGAKALLYVVDSPGGTVQGLAEAGNAIRQAGLPTYAFATGMACSAAYYLAASAGSVMATESAIVGNIGTILAWADCSAFWASAGIEWKAITNEGADLKSTFHLEPNATQLDFLQDSINEAGEQFRQWVMSGRGDKLSPEVFRAGWYSGSTAGALGLIDGNTTLEELRLTIAQ